MPALEDVALWHERDISHSSVERVIGPDATIALDFALVRLTEVVQGLVVYPERMRANLDRLGGLIHSQRVMLALTEAGARARGGLHDRAAERHEGVGEGRRFPRSVAQGQGRDAGAFPKRRCAPQFDLGYHLKHVDTIFARVFGKPARPDTRKRPRKRLKARW